MTRLLPTIAAVLLCASAIAAADAVPRTWGLGWNQGLQLRWQMNDAWELNVMAGPDDYRSEETESVVVDDGDPEMEGVVYVPNDVKEEEGWVRLDCGRTLFADGEIRMTGLLGLSYNWVDRQDIWRNIYELGVDENWHERLKDIDRWTVTATLRLSAAVHERVWLETSFGLRYRWIREDVQDRYRRLDDGDLSMEYVETSDDTMYFDDFGWNGMGQLAVIVWF